MAPAVRPFDRSALLRAIWHSDFGYPGCFILEAAWKVGVHTEFYRGLIIVLSTILTACAVCVSGTIGWIGPDNKRLFPLSIIIGGGFLLLIDTLSRIVSPAELPISILTGLVGAPFYFWILHKQRMNIS